MDEAGKRWQQVKQKGTEKRAKIQQKDETLLENNSQEEWEYQSEYGQYGNTMDQSKNGNKENQKEGSRCNTAMTVSRYDSNRKGRQKQRPTGSNEYQRKG